MKSKLFAFALALIAIATVGFVYTDAQARPAEQVGSAPICKAVAIGKRGSTSIDLATPKAKNLAFTLNKNGTAASVKFKVTGAKNCKVRITANSFYAPALNGKPWSSQVLYDRKTRIFTPGQYTMNASVPTKAKNNMCFYQVDITYGIRNQLPVLAYAHGKIDSCKKKPAATCDLLEVTKLSDTQHRLTASASTKDGAKINSYTFTISKDGKQLLNKTQNGRKLTYTQASPGTYTAKVTVNTSLGKRTNTKCQATFTIKEKPAPKTPGVEIEKKVDGLDHKEINTNTEYTYEITATNTGDVDLKNAVITDNAPEGVHFISVSAGEIKENTWVHTMPLLKIGESQSFTIKAVVPEYLAGIIKNTVCINAPEVNPEAPTKNDHCDEATVTVPPPAKPEECKPGIPVGDTRCEEKACPIPGKEDLPYDSGDCEEIVEEPVKKETPKELPTTGPIETILSLIGAGSLVGSLGYYISSRRTLL